MPPVIFLFALRFTAARFYILLSFSILTCIRACVIISDTKTYKTYRISRNKKKGISMTYEKRKETEIRKNDIQRIEDFIRSVQFGTVTIVIQDGKIVQIERNEKLRLK